MIDLDELLRIAEPVIFVNVPGLELFWRDNMPERCSQSTETTLPDGVTSLAGERCGGVDDVALRCI
jgi:hypothetical protein